LFGLFFAFLQTNPEKDMAVSRKKKKLSPERRIVLSVLFVLALFTFGYFIFQWWQEKRSGFAHYPGFGILLPTGFDIHGIDVSHHQSRIKWEAVKSMKEKSVMLGFAFMKATEGYTRKDRQFGRNWQKAKEVGMPRGAYHFFLPNKNGLIQAQNFISVVTLEKGDLPPVLDIEETYGVKYTDLRKRVKEWLSVIENHYGVKPIIYTNADFYTNILGSEFDDYPLWVAHYLQKNKPRIERPWTFWQYSETGNVNGILSKVDFNVFNGDSSDFEELRIP
jgi:lysozyme